MDPRAALVSEIRRIAEERDRLERKQRRIDTAIAHAIETLRGRHDRYL